jgi:hypothetical protein
VVRDPPAGRGLVVRFAPNAGAPSGDPQPQPQHPGRIDLIQPITVESMECHTRNQKLKEWTGIWLAGLDMELERLSSVHVLGPWGRGPEAIVRINEMATASCGFIAFALRNIRALAVAAFGNGDDRLEAFDRAVPNVVTGRDLFAHPEDYAVGRGKAQGTGVVTQELDWSVNVGAGDLVFVVGGVRIDVMAAAAAALAIAQHIEALPPDVPRDE